MEQQNKFSLTLGSLFDGSGGFPLGGVLAGIAPVWASEIEPFPVRVTTRRFPGMKHYGDITALNGSQMEPVDIITFGSPCQDMSVAGKREGLGGSRSGLFYEAVRIIKEMRGATDGKYPRFIVWENVPGAFSSNKGEDFRAVLEEICRIKDAEVSVPKPAKWETAGHIMGNGYSVAWRQFDAQFWGVPQRRKRIYLVADLDGECAGKILFESEGLSGYSAEGFRAWQETARHPAEGTGAAGTVCLNDQGDRQSFRTGTPKTLKIRSGCEGGGKGALVQDNLSATLSCHNDQTLFQPKAYGICAKHSNSMLSDNPVSGFYEAQTSRTLDGNGGNPSCNQGGIAVIEGNGSRPSHKGDGYKESDVMYTLNATEQHAAAFSGVHATLSANDGPKGPSTQMMKNLEENFVVDAAERESLTKFSSSKASFFTEAKEELANTLVATDYKDPPIVNDGDDAEYIVRRLTPTECARLQGFPDWWCDGLGTGEPTADDIAAWREIFRAHAAAVGKNVKEKSDSQIRKWLQDPNTDSAEYKMWGNGVALPNVVFVLSGIMLYAQNSAG